MSVALSTLILLQLQQNNPNPLFALQQKQLADAIATAVQQYLANNVTVIGTVTPTGTVLGKLTAP